MGDVDGNGAHGGLLRRHGRYRGFPVQSVSFVWRRDHRDANVMKSLSKAGERKALKLATNITLILAIINLDPKRTFGITNPKDLLPTYQKAENFKIRGSSEKLNIALDRLPVFNGLDPGTVLCKETSTSDSLERQERAYDWKNGAWSKDPTST